MAASQGISKKPHFVLPEQSSNIQQIPSKSHSNSLCKTLIVLVLLLVIPLFPSQAPDFVSQSIFTEFWEIIHLLFIGIAVSYGLFGRRSVEKIVDSRNDDSHAYVSGISHLYSVFEDGYENICVNDEDVMQSNANCECLRRNGDEFLGMDRCVLHSAKKIRSFLPNDGGENICVGNEKNVNQAWYSQYSKGESLVVVSNGKYFLGGSSDFKPLNLPVRSLKSRAVVVNDMPEMKRRLESSPKTEAKSNDDGKVVKIRGVVPLNLEKKFEEAAGSPSIPWRSRSGRMGNGEEMNNPKPTAHCRPHSVGEFEFEHLKSRAFRGSKFAGSPEFASSKVENVERKRVSTVPKVAPVNAEASFGCSKINDGGSLEMNASSKVENVERKRVSTVPKVAPVNAEASFGCSKINDGGSLEMNASSKVENVERTRVFTAPKLAPLNAETSFGCSKINNGGLLDMNSPGDLEDNQKNSGHHSEEEVGKGKQAVESSTVATKSSTLAKVLSKAKSVRTIKPNRYIMNQKEQCPSQIDDKLGKMSGKSEADSLVKRGRGEEPENPSVDHQNQELDCISSMSEPRSVLSEFHNEENQDFYDRNVTEPEEDRESEFDKSSDEDDARTNFDNETELGSEVDRKAGEFIAKFREQIRLQKTSSMEIHSGW